MEIILLIAFSSLVLVAFYITQYRKFAKALKEYRQNGRQVLVEDWTKVPKIIMLVLTAIGVAAFVDGLISHNESNWSLGVIMTVCFVTELFATNSQYRLYHDDRSFLTPQGPMLFTAIKDYELNRLAMHIGFVKVHPYAGPTATVCPQAYHWLRDRQQAADQDKKQRKLENRQRKGKKGV